MIIEGYRQRIRTLHQKLGIPDDYEERFALPLQNEAEKLISAGHDMFSRSQQMAPVAYKCWVDMREAAWNEDVQLLLVSAFRSVDYQATIIERKLSEGVAMDKILTTVAAPGYSEHHTGKAIDLTAVDCPPLLESFDKTVAFAWLAENARRFGFELSYPKSNANKIVYEPWHWMLKADH